MDERTLGRSGIRVSPLGFGCWAIGGPFETPAGDPLGWGEVDDDESIRAIRRAVELGVNFFDTADVYGCGHSERVLGRALAGHRDEVVIATKWGNTFDEATRITYEPGTGPEYARQALEASLRRLNTDYVDLFQLHLGDLDFEPAARLRDECEKLVSEGLIRAYGWSTDDTSRAEFFARGPHCAAVQHNLNVFEDAPEMLALCEREGLASVNRTPLAMGLLGARDGSRPAGQGDIRTVPPVWLRYFKDGVPTPEWQAKVDAVRDVLTSDGRTLAQGALAWVWARSSHTVPIPGFRTVAQAEQNASAITKGPLAPEQLAELRTILSTVEPEEALG